MTRPIGVTVSSVVAFIGGIIALLVGAMFFMAAATQAPPPELPQFRGFAYAVAAFVALLGALGIVTSIGLFRMRPWARTSILVFAGIMAAFTLAGGVVIAFVPLPPPSDVPTSAARLVRPLLLTVYGVPFLIGVWWLIQFNTKRAREAFASDAPSETPRRPLIISIIGWFNIVSGVSFLGAAVGGAPALALGFVLSGWSGTLYYVFLAAVYTYLGWRLLQLDERARILTIWWFAITIAHTAFVALTPAARARIDEIQRTMRPEGMAAPAFDMSALAIAMLVVSALLLAAAIWPLIVTKPSFTHQSDRE